MTGDANMLYWLANLEQEIAEGQRKLEEFLGYLRVGLSRM